jgi:hypothetical protein
MHNVSQHLSAAQIRFSHLVERFSDRLGAGVTKSTGFECGGSDAWSQEPPPGTVIVINIDCKRSSPEHCGYQTAALRLHRNCPQ